MKKILLLSVVASLALFANENYIEINGGGASIKDNFNTDSKEIISKHSKADNKSINRGYVDFYVDYKLEEYTKIYLSSEETLNLGMNIIHDFGMLDFGISYTEDREWENPFLLNTKRKKTDSKETGAYIAYGVELNNWSESTLIYSYSKKTYDKESVSSALKREGDRHLISFDNLLKLKLFDLEIDATYEKYDAEGKSSAYDTLYLSVGLEKDLSESFSVELMTDLGTKEYKKRNSIFNKKVDSKIFNTSAMIKYNKPFDWENSYVSLKAEIQREDSNVDFYDKSKDSVLVGIGYKF